MLDPYGWPPAGWPHVVYSIPTFVGEQRWTLEMMAMCLPGYATLLNESPVNRRPDKLAGGDRHSIELTEACNQSRKSQGPVGLFWVHRVSCRRNSCKLVNSVRDQLSHMYTHLCQYGVDQLTLGQGRSELWSLERMLLSSNVIQI